MPVRGSCHVIDSGRTLRTDRRHQARVGDGSRGAPHGVAPALAALCLAGCVTAGPRVMTVRSEVAPVESFARLPAGGPAIITVLERRYRDAIVRESMLATNSRVSGQNSITVTLYGPVGYVTVDDNALGEDSIQPTQIAREFGWYLYGVPMKTSLIYTQNKYGPFGFATGIASTGDRCLYAWQHIERPQFVEAGAISVRLRLCSAKATEQELLSVMYDFDIVGYLPSPLWNPYGRPPRVASNLGGLSAPVEPQLPVTVAEAPAAAAGGDPRAAPPVRSGRNRSKARSCRFRSRVTTRTTRACRRRASNVPFCKELVEQGRYKVRTTGSAGPRSAGPKAVRMDKRTG